MMSAMSKPKLSYFDAPSSRGEECRLALVAAGADFEDHRVKREDWPSLKPQTPFGHMPMLTLEGKPALSEGNAILTYVGRQCGLLPSDAWEAARQESMLSACEDLRAQVGRTFGIKDPEELIQRRTEFVEGPLSVWARGVEAQIKGPFFSGESLGIADIKLFVIVKWLNSGALDHIPANTLAAYAKLSKLSEAVAGYPALQAWFSKYPR